jgi:hypothetical protein
VWPRPFSNTYHKKTKSWPVGIRQGSSFTQVAHMCRYGRGDVRGSGAWSGCRFELSAGPSPLDVPPLIRDCGEESRVGGEKLRNTWGCCGVVEG